VAKQPIVAKTPPLASGKFAKRVVAKTPPTKDIYTKEIRKDKYIATPSVSKAIVRVIDEFEPVNPNYARWYENITQRAAIERMLTIHGEELVVSVVKLLVKTNTMTFVPTITTPVELEKDWARLKAALIKHKAKRQEDFTNKYQAASV
jgi:hypothetical protein